MRILAFSDIHGAFEAVLRAVDAESCEGVLLAGDLTVRSIGEVERGLQGLRERGKWVLGISGNIDTRSTDHILQSFGADINGEGRLVEDVGFFGAAGGPMSSIRSPYELSDPQILENAERGYAMVRDARITVFVPHVPPFGTQVDLLSSGRHGGSGAVREFIETRSPDLVVCGHIHEARGIDMIDKTTIVNCGAAYDGHYCVIDIGERAHAELRHSSAPAPASV